MTLATTHATTQAVPGLLPTPQRRCSCLPAAPRCPRCSSRDLVDLTPPEEDRGWWSRLHCRACEHRWSIRS